MTFLLSFAMKKLISRLKNLSWPIHLQWFVYIWIMRGPLTSPLVSDIWHIIIFIWFNEKNTNEFVYFLNADFWLLFDSVFFSDPTILPTLLKFSGVALGALLSFHCTSKRDRTKVNIWFSFSRFVYALFDR